MGNKMLVQTIEAIEVNFRGFTLKKGFVVIADERGIGLSSGWTSNGELFVYRRINGEWVGNWEELGYLTDNKEDLEVIVEWDLYDEEEERTICGGGGFTSVFAEDYDSARRKAMAKCIENLKEKEIIDIGWNYGYVTYKDDMGIYSLCNFR